MGSTKKPKKLKLKKGHHRGLGICAIVGIVSAVCYIGIVSSRDVRIHTCIKQYLQEFNFSDSDYSLKKIRDYREVTVEKKEVSVTDWEVEQYIQNDLEAHEETVAVKRNKIKKNDVVSVEYTVLCDGSVVNEVGEESFMVGAGKYNEQIENALIGKNWHEIIVFNIKVPEDDQNSLYAGKTETVTLKVKNIYKIKKCQLTRDFVYDNYGYETVDAYYQYVNDTLFKQKEAENQIQMQTELLHQVSDCFDLDIEKEKVAQYSVDIVDTYKEYAYLDGLSLEEYISDELNMTKDDFYQMCYEEGLEEIKSFLVIGAVAEEEKLQVTEKEFEDWNIESLSTEHSKTDIYAYILKSKVENILSEYCHVSNLSHE